MIFKSTVAEIESNEEFRNCAFSCKMRKEVNLVSKIMEESGNCVEEHNLRLRFKDEYEILRIL